jgi:DNA gyrase subunit A
VNKAALISQIASLVQEKTIDGITDIRDESDKSGIRIVIELRRGVIPKVVLNNLYKHTQLQTTFGAIMLAIDGGRPRIMNLKEMLQLFIAHRFEVITRRTQFELAKAEARAHILEGLKIALDNLDEVVKIIRNAKSRDEAKKALMGKFALTEIQANAILDMRLYQLTGLERDKLEEEYLELIKLISYLRDLLDNKHKIYALIREDLLKLKETYGDERRTQIVPDEGEVSIEDLIADRSVIVTMSHEGYIKRVPISTYKAQKRGGKGVAGMETKETDYVEHLFVANTHDYILFFTQNGRIYWEKVYEIPEASRTAKGKAIVNLLEMKPDEKITAMVKIREFPENQYLVFATKKGIIKKTNLSQFDNPRKAGIIAIAIDEGDELIGVQQTAGNNDIVLVTKNAMSLRFSETELRDQGRDTRGVIGIRLEEDDAVETIEVVNDKATLFICTENGYGKRTSFEEYRGQHRGGKGIYAIKPSDRNGLVVGAHSVMENDSIMLITIKGQMIKLAVKEIRVISRVTQGVRLIKLEENDKLVSATTVEPDEEEENISQEDSASDSPEQKDENGAIQEITNKSNQQKEDERRT